SGDSAEEIYVDFCRKKGLGETRRTWVRRRLSGYRWKAKYISGAIFTFRTVRFFLHKNNFFLASFIVILLPKLNSNTAIVLIYLSLKQSDNDHCPSQMVQCWNFRHY